MFLAMKSLGLSWEFNAVSLVRAIVEYENVLAVRNVWEVRGIDLLFSDVACLFGRS
jgi:hypothetical protein